MKHGWQCGYSSSSAKKHDTIPSHQRQQKVLFIEMYVVNKKNTGWPSAHVQRYAAASAHTRPRTQPLSPITVSCVPGQHRPHKARDATETQTQAGEQRCDPKPPAHPLQRHTPRTHKAGHTALRGNTYRMLTHAPSRSHALHAPSPLLPSGSGGCHTSGTHTRSQSRRALHPRAQRPRSRRVPK